MKTIHKYIASTFFVSFAVTLVIVTFVISMGVIFRVTDLLARGISWRAVLNMYLCGIPVALTFSMPVSALTASLLVFGRLSADAETAAMKACGISMWQIVAMPLVLSLIMMSVCLYLSDELAPLGHYRSRQIMRELGSGSALQLLDEGRFIQDFNGFILFIGKKRKERVFNVRIYDLRDKRFKREIQAKWGLVSADPNTKEVVLDLYSVRINRFSKDSPFPVFCEKWPLKIGNPLGNRTYKKSENDLTFLGLIEGMRNPAVSYPNLNPVDQQRQKMAFAVELNKRIVLAVSCFAFVLLGIPLGVTAQRKESSTGIGISLFLVFNFYLFVIIAESIANKPEFRPDLIIWMPVVIAVALGSYLVERTN
ncbi:MAG: LptF/LptG family permease [Kiritimatiellae bacterium]|nr:LptF/LptG family permease [Kiritimatiellia bacterium]MDD5520221.1 LptF/LptG family permease [Kiritimatiellia bacterium]